MNIQNLTNQEKLFFDKQVDNISKDINVDLSVLVKNIPDDNEILLLCYSNNLLPQSRNPKLRNSLVKGLLGGK